jgi:predicted extracellular nuclease
VEVTVTDSAATPVSDVVTFTWVIDPAPSLISIAEIQGTTDTSPVAGDVVTTQGVVTASYPTGGYNGFYLQTGGSPATPDASDGLFVFSPSLGAAAFPAIGDSVQVTGTVSEFNGLTEITVNNANIVDIADLPAVVPLTDVPGTGCALPGDACPTGAELDAAREAHEGELIQPTGDYTVTDSYDGSAYNGGTFSSSFFGEIGLAANSDVPLVTPTEVEDAQTGDVDGRTAYNDAHRVILDDGSDWNYSQDAHTDDPFPYFTPTHTVRVGADVSFPAPVVLDYRFGWKLQPRSQVVGAPTGQVTFEQDRPAQPTDVGGDLELATFNVLNYFTTLGADVPGCTPFVDREDNPITVDECTAENGPRGAWNAENLARQQAKIVSAINSLDADIVSLEEIENSLAVDGADRDEALSALTSALNSAAGSTRWAFVDSPAALPASEDAIRTGFIYDPDTVELIGEAQILVGSAAFDNARQPLAQAFKAVGTDDTDGFAVIANHFKSKGCGDPAPTGDNAEGVQGCFNGDRTRQAAALATFADQFAVARGVEKVFLAGDFNAYSSEDPVQVLEAEGYTRVESDDPDEESYNFDGQVGSLDHVFANAAALPDVTGADIWTINAYESVYYEYSRFNYNVTNLYDDGPFRSSDHNPEIVGIEIPGLAPATPTVTASDVSLEYGQAATVTVAIGAPAGITPTGTVTVSQGGTTLATGTVSGAVASVVLPARSLPPGVTTLTASYSGDANLAPGSDTFSASVAKAGSVTEAKVKPKKPKAGRTVKLKVTVVGDNGVEATGQVKIKVGNKTKTKTLKNGKLKLNLGKFGKGKHKVKVVYLGSATVEGSKDKVTFTVT